MGIIYKNGVQYGGDPDLNNSFININSYKSSLKDTLQNLVGNFAQVETNPTTYAHNQGDLLIFNGTLYKVTSSLSIGTVLAIGTNIISTNVDQNIIKPANIVNNATTDDSTKVASAAVAKNLQDQITTLNSNLGIVTNDSLNGSGSVSVANDTETTICTITLAKGNWCIVACGDWASNATGYRQIAVATGLNPARQAAVTTMAVNGSNKQTYQQLVRFANVTSDSLTLTLYARQNSGSSLTLYPNVYAMKVG